MWLPQFAIYFIIVIDIYLAEGRLLEAGGGHPQGSWGGLAPGHLPSFREIKSITDHLGWDVSVVTSRRADVSSARGQLPGRQITQRPLVDGSHPRRGREAPPARLTCPHADPISPGLPQSRLPAFSWPPPSSRRCTKTLV